MSARTSSAKRDKSVLTRVLVIIAILSILTALYAPIVIRCIEQYRQHHPPAAITDTASPYGTPSSDPRR